AAAGRRSAGGARRSGQALLFARDPLCRQRQGERMSAVGGGRLAASGPATAVLWRGASFLVTLALTFIGLTAVTFVISRLTNIDPVLAVVGDKATKEVYDKTFAALGLDRPLIVQYGLYLKRLVSGDLGVSVLTSQPVLSDLLRVFPATL